MKPDHSLLYSNFKVLEILRASEILEESGDFNLALKQIHWISMPVHSLIH